MEIIIVLGIAVIMVGVALVMAGLQRVLAPERQVRLRHVLLLLIFLLALAAVCLGLLLRYGLS